jgi:cell division protein FtsB
VRAAALRAARGRETPRRAPRSAGPRKTPAGMLVRTVRGAQVRRFAASFALLVVLALAKVWIGLQVVATGYQLSDLRREQLRLDEYRQQLEVELATLQSRTALEERSRRTLGMVTPRRGQVVDVR